MKIKFFHYRLWSKDFLQKDQLVVQVYELIRFYLLIMLLWL